MKSSALSLAIGLLMAASALAGEATCGPAGCEQVETCGSPNCCGRCGHHGCCDRYCCVVPTTKTVIKTVWVVKCEEYCRSLPGCPLGCGSCNDPSCAGAGSCGGGESKCAHEGCASGCCGKGECGPCAVELAKRQTPPKCGGVHCKKTLEKKEIKCEVPTYKCVVTYACPHCGAAGGQPCGGESAPAATPIQAAPVPVTPTPLPQAPLPPPPKSAGMMPQTPMVSDY